MKRKRERRASIPDKVKREVEAIVERCNRENSKRDDCYYEAQFPVAVHGMPQKNFCVEILDWRQAE